MMKTLLDILQLSTEYLKQKGIQHPRRQAEELIADSLKMERMQIYLEYDRPMTEAEIDLCRQRISKRGKGEPWQYILGEISFYNCRIKTTPDALIPRQETEILVDKIAIQLKQLDLKGKKLWDLCCGSGCIGIALKKQFPDLHVEMADICPKALNLAQKNAALNGVDVAFYQGDRFLPFAGQTTDFLVCNPPYIPESEFASLDPEVREFEPYQALVSGPNGLEFYEYLSQELKKMLNPKGKAWMEIGTGQGSQIKNLFSHSSWTLNRVEQDWAGHDRFFFLEIE